MKVAKTLDDKSVVASETAPATAVCPNCQQTVTLRKRRQMGTNGYTYFWRHRENSGVCSNKRSPYSIL